MAEAKESNNSPGDTESQVSDSRSKKGGTMTGVLLSGYGWLTNIIVYLVEEFNIESIDASQISNVLHGCMNMIPIIGAFIADSYLGINVVSAICNFISLLGLIMLTLTAKLGSLRPPPCETGSNLCQAPSKQQMAILYVSLTMASVGFGGTRYALATVGANQLDKPKDKDTFFNWFFFIWYSVWMISSTALVYVEDSISWGLGYGISFAANFVAVVIFFAGYKIYRHDKPQGSPFTALIRVVVAAVRKRGLILSSKTDDYYQEHDGTDHHVMPATPNRSFRFLNRAALKTEGDINSDGSVARPWKLCSLQQVEDLKNLIRIFPIWSSAIFLTIPMVIQQTITVIQALAMDRHLGSKFKIPAASIIVVTLISSSIFVALFDRFLFPTWQRWTGRPLTLLQRIGIAHVVNVICMAISALVESKRLKIAHAHNLDDQAQHSAIVPMTVWWLFPQLVVVGIGEAFQFPGQTALYYQEFPVSLRSTATAMVSLVVGIAFYVSTALVDLMRNVTGWLPKNINRGRLDNVYWVFVVLGSLNFIYFLVCAKFYKYQNIEKEVDDYASR
ncbi:Proton-dependent oligopeptide transporter family [Corchorus olitorius]|uniref:Proton-dependent oligopeptide transporter family n=1 Tax=Corchorus olitorius TaxID=93759 RepID=A0A1R3J9A7_9ROSI|nr:Proton-dependent oligopeptide transporter family [Corchorus olitorius]